MKRESLKSLGKVGCYILLPCIFLLIPTSWFESRRSLCLIYAVSGVRCPGCGMTRAISCVVHGDFKKALSYNKLVVLVFPLLCYTWFRSLMREYRRYVCSLFS